MVDVVVFWFQDTEKLPIYEYWRAGVERWTVDACGLAIFVTFSTTTPTSALSVPYVC